MNEQNGRVLSSPTQQLLTVLAEHATHESILIVGSGKSGLPFVVAMYCAGNIVVYDPSPLKILYQSERWEDDKTVLDHTRIHGSRTNPFGTHGAVEFTMEQPTGHFDLALAVSSWHHAPHEIADLMTGLAKRVCIIDYDMQGMAEDEFSRRWGRNRHEQVERQILGDQMSYRLHTALGLEDCTSQFEHRGCRTDFAEGNMNAVPLGGLIPATLHFVYKARTPLAA